MKIDKSLIDILDKNFLNNISGDKLINHINEVKKSGKYKDLKKRILWDIFNANFRFNYDNFTKPAYDAGANDEHIYTVLKYLAKKHNIEVLIN